jgi:NAD(P)-dependent dehydrogenase (short-subunit alcohol dehydrogenase family)
VFLVSPLGDYINGTVIPVDGGWSLGGVTVMSHELAKFFYEHEQEFKP